jgi:hypothetical protein
MIARRPQPDDTRLIRLLAPLDPEQRYVLFIRGVRGLTGVSADRANPLRVGTPQPRR